MASKSFIRKLSDWIVTESGQNFAFGAAVVGVVGVTGFELMPHSFLLTKYREIVQLYKSGIEVPLNKKVLERFNKAVDLLKLSKQERYRLKPFTVFGFDIFSAGSFYFRNGGIVGIPISFSYENVESIDKSDIKVNNESVIWATDEGQQLLESLVLSENAQLFAIAREIYMIKSAKRQFQMFYSPLSLAGLYLMCHNINQRAGLYVKPRAVRVIMYAIAGVFWYGVYSFLYDYTEVSYEEKADKYLTGIDPMFALGGEEFYRKLLERNKALRKLMKAEGEARYSVIGNECYGIRYRHLPIAARWNFFQKQLEGNIL